MGVMSLPVPYSHFLWWHDFTSCPSESLPTVLTSLPFPTSPSPTRPAPSPGPRGAARCGTTTRHPGLGARAAPPASLLITSFPGVLTAAALPPPLSPHPPQGSGTFPLLNHHHPAFSQGSGQGWGLPQPDPFRLTPSQPRLPLDSRAERKAFLSLPAEAAGRGVRY